MNTGVLAKQDVYIPVPSSACRIFFVLLVLGGGEGSGDKSHDYCAANQQTVISRHCDQTESERAHLVSSVRRKVQNSFATVASEHYVNKLLNIQKNVMRAAMRFAESTVERSTTGV